jgi:preprotein translocase subunit SecA
LSEVSAKSLKAALSMEYKREGFDLFMAMMRSMKSELMRTMFQEVKVDDAALQKLAEERKRAVEARQQLMQGQHPGAAGAQPAAAGVVASASEGGVGAAAAQAAAQARANQAAQQARMSQPVTRKERRAAAARGATLDPAAVLPEPVTIKREGPKLGRNDPCHCGSGKKYKSCHYQEDRALEASGG